jgi:hypothetical protein
MNDKNKSRFTDSQYIIPFKPKAKKKKAKKKAVTTKKSR